jgi:Secretion system C-terminal sorting domain
MKINLLLAISFLSIIIYANIDEMHGIVGLTKRDGSIGCVCHDLNPTNTVHVWIEGPDSVLINTAAQFKLFITGGPDVAGGFNIASFFGEVDSVDTLTKVLFGELTHTSPNPSQNDTISWNFLYTSPDSILTDTIYSVGNSVNGNSNPSGDQWNFGENFVVNVIDNPVPVELSNLIVVANLNNVQISWETLTEVNNSGFEIERASSSTTPGQDRWEKIGFVPGFGTTTENHSYSYNDNHLQGGRYYYRLKQINQNGSFVYSDIINIDITTPEEFALEQNYPNPFNPSTKIRFQISDFGFVSLKVYDILGNEVATLVNEEKHPGTYEVEFSPESSTQHPASGIYFYKLEAGNFTDTKKMILMK